MLTPPELSRLLMLAGRAGVRLVFLSPPSLGGSQELQGGAVIQGSCGRKRAGRQAQHQACLQAECSAEPAPTPAATKDTPVAAVLPLAWVLGKGSQNPGRATVAGGLQPASEGGAAWVQLAPCSPATPFAAAFPAPGAEGPQKHRALQCPTSDPGASPCCPGDHKLRTEQGPELHNLAHPWKPWAQKALPQLEAPRLCTRVTGFCTLDEKDYQSGSPAMLPAVPGSLGH